MFQEIHSVESCQEIASENFTDTELKKVALVCLFSLVSIAFTSTVAMMMKYNPQLMAHPNLLIYYMCLCEGIIAWQAMISQL